MIRPRITPTEKRSWSVFDGRPECPHARRCTRCDGEGGWDAIPWGAQGKDSAYHWTECPACNGKREFTSQMARCVRRYWVHASRHRDAE